MMTPSQRDGWRVALLSDFAKVSSGATPSRSRQEFWGGDIPWITTSKICYGEITSADEHITPEGLASSSTKIYPQGTILLAMYGQGATRGRVGVLGLDATINQACAAIEPSDALISDYLYHYLVHHYTDIRNLSQGGNQANLSGELVKSFRLLVPPLEDQINISGILTLWDQVINLTEKLIAEKQLLRKGLMQQLLTGKRRLPGFDGEWRECEIGSLFKEINRPVTWDDDELYRLISVRRRSGGLFQRESLYGHQILTKNLKTVHTGDYLISKMQVLHGATGLVTPEFNGMKVSGSYISLIPRKSAVISTEFFSYFSQLPSFYHLTYLASYGVHIEKMTFNLKWFMQSKLTIPPTIEEQTAIVKFLKLVDQEIDLLLAKADALREQKKGLMQQLLTGKILVNTGGGQ